jgi:hypothetical protein
VGDEKEVFRKSGFQDRLNTSFFVYTPPRLFIGCGLPVQRFAHARRGAAFRLGAKRLRLVRKLPMHQATHRPMNMRACLSPCPPSSFTDAFLFSPILYVKKVPVSLCRTDGSEVVGFIAVRIPSVLQQNRKKRHLRPYDQSCFVQQ